MKCMKMKVGLGALAVVLGLAVLGFTKPGQKLAGLLEVAWDKTGVAVEQAVPLKFEIDRIEKEVGKLGDDVKSNTSAVIKEEVQTERLRDEVKDTRANLAKRLDDLSKMKAALDSGDSQVKIGGRTFPLETVRTKFRQDWESYKSAEAALKAKEGLIEQRQKQIDAARAKIDEMKSQQDQLRTEVAKMRADLEAAELAQAKSDVQIDESRLANIKSSMKDVKSRTEVLVREAKEQGQFTSTAPTVDDALKNVKAEDEFDLYIGGTKVKADK
jgi:chromosome segregation ATPase